MKEAENVKDNLYQQLLLPNEENLDKPQAERGERSLQNTEGYSTLLGPSKNEPNEGGILYKLSSNPSKTNTE